MAFYIRWSWAFHHEPDGRCLWYYEEDTRTPVQALFPFCYNHELIYQGTQLNVSIQLS